MEAITILLSCLIFHVSGQFENHPMPFHPIPVLQISNSGLQNSSNTRYSVVGNGNLEDKRKDEIVVELNNLYTPHRRNVVSGEIPYKSIYSKRKIRNIPRRRHGGYHTRHPRKSSKAWQTKSSEPKQLRYSIQQNRKDAIYTHAKNTLRGESRHITDDAIRNPSIIKYIADENGFAIRENVYHPLHDTISRQRQRQRILTASGSSPLMSQVVTSAIKVTNGQMKSSQGGKYVPQIVDLKIG